MTDVQKNYQFFDTNRDSIIKDHEGKYVLLKDEKVIDYFETMQQAIEKAKNEGWQVGSFGVQHCVTEKEETGYYANWTVCFG